MRIQNNITAQNSHRQYGINVASQSKTMEKLSSGYRVNRAADDAAGLAISEKMRTQIRGLTQAGRNVQDGCSLLQVADAAMQTVSNIIQRMREIAVQSANDTNDNEVDRAALDLEYQQLMEELDQIAETTNFNGVYPLKGTGVVNPFDVKISETVGVSGPSITANAPSYAGPGNVPETALSPQVGNANNLRDDGGGLNPIFEVEDTAASVTYPGSITGNTTVTGAFRIDASAITADAEITVPSGSTLIIEGTLSRNITFTGGGDVRINGNITGNITNNVNMTIAGTVTSITGTVNNGAAGRMRVEADGVNIGANNGDMHILGQNVTVDSNSRNLFVGSADLAYPSAGFEFTLNTNTSTGQVRIEADGATISSTNDGHASISGSDAFIHTNNNRLLITGVNGTVINNTLYFRNTAGASCRIENNTSTGIALLVGVDAQIDNNHGNLYIEGDDAKVSVNHPTGNLMIGTEMLMHPPNIPLYKAWVGTNDGAASIYSHDAQVDTNNKDLLLYGDNAKVITNTANGKVRVEGSRTTPLTQPYVQSEASIATNNGIAHIEGSNILVWQNTKTVFVAGTPVVIYNNAAGSDAVITGNQAEIVTNSGNAVVSRVGSPPTGIGTTVGTNEGSGKIRFINDPDAKIMVNNGGRIEIAANSTLTRLAMNTGTILVEDNGHIYDTVGMNAGRIEVGPLATINLHTSTGTIISKGTTTLNTNSGTLEVGTWPAPPAGSPDGKATVTTNNGTLRNFSANGSFVTGGSGPVENYGTMDPLSGGNVRHHVRDADVSGIDANNEGPQTIRIFYNNTWETITGTFIVGADSKSHLTFESTEDNVIFDAMPLYASVPNTRYGIGKEAAPPVAGSIGTSGHQLIFTIYQGFYIQSGANEGDATELSFRPLNPRFLAAQSADTGLGTTHIRDMEHASQALTVTLQAINDVSLYRAELGAQYNRLEYTYANVTNTTENIAAAESRIRDADMAKEMTIFTKNSILSQSSTAMLAQANALPQGVLQLLG